MEEPVFCCICLNSTLLFFKTNDYDSKCVQWLQKLISCVPEIEWSENWILCVTCSTKLDRMYDFKIECFNLEIHRKDKTLDIRSNQEKENQSEVKHDEENIGTKSFKSKYSLKRHIKMNIENKTLDENLEQVSKVSLVESNLMHIKFIDVSTEVNIKRDPSNVVENDTNNVRKLSEIRIKKKLSSFDEGLRPLYHMQEKHKSHLETETLFRCDECNNAFNSSSNLMQHKKYHLGKRTHICSHCGKGFITKGDLNVHEKHHLNKREYECDVCTKRFNTHKDIRSHKLVVHSDPKVWTYVCSYCDKRFPIKSNLDLHMRRHTGDKPFACHLCEKRFVEKVVLQKHIKSHSNVRAFKCTECDRRYKDKKILEIHLKKVHDIGDAKVPVRTKKYFCLLCPKSYFAKNKLTRHMCSHTGLKPFCCEICQKKFTDKSYVKQHLKTVHNFIVNKIND